MATVSKDSQLYWGPPEDPVHDTSKTGGARVLIGQLPGAGPRGTGSQRFHLNCANKQAYSYSNGCISRKSQSLQEEIFGGIKCYGL